MCNPVSPGPPHPACGMVSDQPPRPLMKLRSISVCNKAQLWGKTHSDWLGLAQPCEIHRLRPNLFQLIDFLTWTVSQWNCCMSRLYFCSVYTHIDCYFFTDSLVLALCTLTRLYPHTHIPCCGELFSALLESVFLHLYRSNKGLVYSFGGIFFNIYIYIQLKAELYIHLG